MQSTLHPILRTKRHIIAKVIKTKFVVGTVGDVAVVSDLSFGAVGAEVVDTADAELEEFYQRADLLGIPAGEAIVDRADVDALAAESVEVSG